MTAAVVEIKTPPQSFSLAPRNLEEAFQLAEMLAASDMVPKDFKGKPGNVMIAMQWGMEVGLKPLQALQNIAVINGRPSMWGDAVLALVRASPLCEYVLEDEDGSGTAICRAKRRGEQEQTRTFSNADAKTAGLLNKAGPWTTSPKRMKQMRARSFALRDVFTDVLKGMDIAEVLMDLPPLDATPVRALHTDTPTPDLLHDARSAAARGVAAYQTFWQAAGKANRLLLAAEHVNLKAAAEQADAARTVEAGSEEPIDPFVAEMESAEGAPQ